MTTYKNNESCISNGNYRLFWASISLKYDHFSLSLIMTTVLKNWHIVSILENRELVGKVLWGICVEDETLRFDTGDYVCSSKIVEIIPTEKLVKTCKGSSYLLEGDGTTTEVNVEDFELLRQGFSPDEINRIRAVQQDEIN